MTLAWLAVAWLLTYLLHSTMLLGGGWLLTATGVVRSPVAKDTLWKVCLVGGLLTASVQSAFQDRNYGRHFWLPGAAKAAQSGIWTDDQPVAANTPVRGIGIDARHSTTSVVHVSRGPAAGASVSVLPTPYTLAPNPSSSRAPTWPVLLLFGWAAGAVLLTTRLAFRRLRFSRRLEGRRELREGVLVESLESLRSAARVRRRVRLAISARLTGPVAMGRSEICLPERALSSLTPAEQRAVLAHELGHLVRQDPSWLALAVLVESVFFLQPLNRLARRRIQEAAEYLCDDWAVDQMGGSLPLAKCLAEVATWIQASRRPVPVSGMAENRSQLVERVQRLLDGVQPPAVRGLRLAVPVAALALSTVAFAAPGVLPPCTAGQPSAVAAAAGRSTWASDRGDPRTWATIRDGRLLVFRSGFAPRITGQGRIGIRRGGRAIELMDDQQLTVNGQPVADDEAVAVSERDTVRIVDEHGATVWSLVPVRIASDRSRWESSAAAEADQAEDVEPQVESLDEDLDTIRVTIDNADAADLARSAAAVGRLGDRLGRAIEARIEPLAGLQKIGTRVAADLAPQLADMGVGIAADVGAALAQAFGDSAACGCNVPGKHSTRALRRGIDGHKRLR
jgi:beta-lactamase regulating signal transducer with metallopeptidase domain